MNILSRKSFDVILLDLSLPDSDGITSLLRILSAARNTPVVVMSGQAEGDLAVCAIRAGNHFSAGIFLFGGDIQAIDKKRAVFQTARFGKRITIRYPIR